MWNLNLFLICAPKGLECPCCFISLANFAVGGSGRPASPIHGCHSGGSQFFSFSIFVVFAFLFLDGFCFLFLMLIHPRSIFVLLVRELSMSRFSPIRHLAAVSRMTLWMALFLFSSCPL